MLPDPVSRDELHALADADFVGLPREALIASIHYLAAELLSVGDLCQRMSPSAIPDLRQRARLVRSARPAGITAASPVYGLDSLCDYLEAVFYKVGVGGCGFDPPPTWAVYDQLRTIDPEWTCAATLCPLSAEWHKGYCIVHRDFGRGEASV